MRTETVQKTAYLLKDIVKQWIEHNESGEAGPLGEDANEEASTLEYLISRSVVLLEKAIARKRSE